MVRLVAVWVITLCIIASPKLIEVGTTSPQHIALLKSPDKDCTALSLPLSMPAPAVKASNMQLLGLSCKLDSIEVYLQLYRFSYVHQAPGFEAVSSQNLFVPEKDLQRFGRSKTKTSFGVVNHYSSSANQDDFGGTWQWYEIGGKIYASERQVKIAEFLNAARFSESAIPQVYVAQWRPQTSAQKLTELQSEQLALLLASIVGYPQRDS